MTSPDYDGESQWRYEARRMLQSPKSILFPEPAKELEFDMQEYLAQRNLSYIYAYMNGWYASYHNGPRIIIPCVRSQLAMGPWWQGRLLENVAPNAMNYKRWDSPHGPRGDALCYLNYSSNVIIVEGPMDALAAAAEGFSAIALLGANPPGDVLAHASIIINGRSAVCITDRDSLKFWIKIQNRLGEMGVHTQIVEPPSPFKDLAAMPITLRSQLFKDIQWPKQKRK